MYPPTIQSTNNSLQQAASAYLTALEDTVPETTYWSHKQSVNSFVDWAHSKRHQFELETLAARFARELTLDSDYTEETVHGCLCSLVNLIAYTRRDDPEIVAVRVANALSEQTNTDVSSILKPLEERLSQNKNQSEWSEIPVSELVAYLRRSCYGSRTHAYTETILGTKGRPSLVQKLNLGDVNLDQGTAQIRISETYLVGSSNLVGTREVDLPKSTHRTLEEYIRFNRTSVDQADTKALFTTHNGRASHSTLRRAIKQDSRKTNSTEHNTTESDTSTTSPVCPSDVWWYALSNTLECIS